MKPDEFAHLDAAYVLGALGQEERRAYERHLEECASCARAVQEMAGMPALLAHVDESAFLSDQDEEPVPETLLPGLLREVRRTRRRRLAWAGAAAAAAAVIGVGGAVAWTQYAGPATDEVAVSPAVTSVPMRQVDQSAVRASIAMEEVAWGTKLELTCSYVDAGDGYSSGETPSYTLAVQTRNGEWQQVATWKAVPGRTITVSAATAATAEDIASVEVRTTSGSPVLDLES